MRPKVFLLIGSLLALTIAAARESLAAGLTVGVVAALIGATLVPVIFAQSIQQLVELAQRLAKGDLTVASHAQHGEQLIPLRRALGEMAQTLSQTMDSLRDERDVLGRILDRMEEGVLVLDDSRRILRANPALRDMLLPRPTLLTSRSDASHLARGTVPSLMEVRGKTVLEVFRNAELATLLESVAIDGRVTGEIGTEGLKPRRLLVRAIRYEQPYRGYLVVFVDMTDVRRLESLRRDFVANVSHELLTPVAAIRAAAETVRGMEGRDPARVTSFMEIIERNTDRLHALVKDLLELSRIESREFKLAWENLDVSRVLEQAMSMFRLRAETRKQVLSCEVQAEAEHMVADRRALEMIVSNLVDNACKYCPEGARIRVTAQRDEQRTVLQVSDDGPGIGNEHLPRLFERFYRIDPGRSRDRGGTGLGLSIVKHLAEAMGGQAQVVSALRHGTTFKILLPHRKSDGPVPRNAPPT